MTCRHGIDDPKCTSYRTPEERVERKKKEIDEIIEKYDLEAVPDYSDFEIMSFMGIGHLTAVMVKFPSCDDCVYEGVKVMVFRDVEDIDIMNWKIINPHFRNPDEKKKREAPSPIARFPGDADGWNCAIGYLKHVEAFKNDVGGCCGFGDKDDE